MSDQETPAGPPKRKLQVAKRGKRKHPTRPIDFGHGVFAHARTLDAFEHARTIAEAKADLNAVLAGAPPKHAWSFTAERIELLRESADLRQVTIGWMSNVLGASLAVERFDDGAGGEAPLELVTYADDGETVLQSEVMQPGFAAFELLFQDATIEMRYRIAALGEEGFWSAEKNVSAPVPNGHGRADTITAQPAETPATLAHAVEQESSLMETADPARLLETRREAAQESSPGKPPAQEEPGSEQA